MKIVDTFFFTLEKGVCVCVGGGFKLLFTNWNGNIKSLIISLWFLSRSDS